MKSEAEKIMQEKINWQNYRREMYKIAMAEAEARAKERREKREAENRAVK